MEISDLKNFAALLTRYYAIQKIVRIFEQDIMYPSGSRGCITVRGQN